MDTLTPERRISSYRRADDAQVLLHAFRSPEEHQAHVAFVRTLIQEREELRQRRAERKAMWAAARNSALGHLFWAVIVATGMAGYNIVKWMIDHWVRTGSAPGQS